MWQQYVPNISAVQSYIAVSVLILQVASILSECYICFTDILQVYVLMLHLFSYVSCIYVFHVVRRVNGCIASDE